MVLFFDLSLQNSSLTNSQKKRWVNCMPAELPHSLDPRFCPKDPFLCTPPHSALLLTLLPGFCLSSAYFHCSDAAHITVRRKGEWSSLMWNCPIPRFTSYSCITVLPHTSSPPTILTLPYSPPCLLPQLWQSSAAQEQATLIRRRGE